jgi:uncharacterized protein YecT (DUF1311 family)
MVAKVFISYRRDDIAGVAGRVSDRLAQEFGSDSLFMDVDSIPLGVNFVNALDNEVAKCDVLLAIIGRGWLDARDKDGQRRLDNQHDYVRIEIAAALKRDIPVIPILIDGAQVPNADQLPDNLKDLALRNGLNVRHDSFHSDTARLIHSLKELPPSQSKEPGGARGRTWLIGGGVAGVAVITALVWLVVRSPPPTSSPTAAPSGPVVVDRVQDTQSPPPTPSEQQGTKAPIAPEPGSQIVYLRPRTVERPSAGISCTAPQGPIEVLICADADLALEDARLDQTYRKKLDELGAQRREVLRQSQRDWLNLRNANCNVPKAGNWSAANLAPAKPCILQMTRQRVAELGG